MTIIESISKKGISITHGDMVNPRMQIPKSGDILKLPDGDFAMISSLNEWAEGQVSYVRLGNIYGGRANMQATGNADISGGPFEGCPIKSLMPTFTLHEANFWAWSNSG